MDVRGFITDAQYRIEGSQARIYLFGRLENKRSFITRHSAEPYFTIRSADRNEAERLLEGRARIEENTLKTPDEEETVRIITRSPKDIPELRKLFENANIPCFEADVRFVRRFLIDHGIQGDVHIRGAADEHDRADLFFDEPRIEGCERTRTTLRVMSFDIETNADASELYSIAAVDSTGDERAFIVSENPVAGAEHHPDAQRALEAFFAYVIERDPDIITGWNVVDFDFARIRDYASSIRIGRLDWDATMRIFSDFLKSSSVQIPGRQVIDGIELLRTSWVDLEDYTLQTASNELLGESKEIVGNRGAKIQEAYEQRPEELISYNRKDASLVLSILDKLDLINLTMERSRITGLLMDEVRGAVASLDSMYLRELKAQGYVYYSVKGG